MNSEDIDKIIADAVADSKKKSKWHKPGRKSNNILTARKWLDWVFMIGFVAAIIIYFTLPDQKALFFGVGFGAIMVKLIEFYLRFML